MKKKIIGIITLLFLLSGCNSKNTDITNQLKNKLKKLDSYNIKGELEITNNESTYKYDIEVSYEQDEKYKVNLKNKTNSHEQIILKNSDGVYVLTPSLNKSFKFQSEWPYSNSQSYIYQTILNDIDNDSNKKVEQTKDGYIITTKVNYSNNKDLKNQKIYIDKNLNIKKVEVLDKNGITKIKMTYKKVEHNKKFNNDYFKLSNNIKEDNKEEKTNKPIDIAYPLYIPKNTKLDSQDTIKENERTILTFKGEDSFTLIEQAANKENNNQIISVDGEIEFVNGVIGNITDNEVSFISGGVEYYATSNTMDTKELLEVVNSISTIPVGK